MRYIVVTLALCLMVVSAYAGTYVENFDDGNFNGWEIYDAGKPGSKWTVENGILTGRREIVWMSDLLFGKENWRNYSIECDARILEPLDEIYGMAIDLRVTFPPDDESKESSVSCLASGSDKRAYIWPWIDGEFPDQKTPEDFPTTNFDFELGRWYRLKAVAHEDTFEFYIDGRIVLSYTDKRFPTGRLGVMAAGASVLQFDNIIITGPDVPDNTASMVDGDLLAIIYWFEEAWRSHNIDLLFSLTTDDYTFEWPPSPSMNREETISMVEWYMATYPNTYVHEGLTMASAKNGVAVMEHTDTYIWPDNGAPIEDFHICVEDFNGPRIKKGTSYGDVGITLIQAGVMPPRKLGDMIPSFPLPAVEATGLTPVKASAELLKRLNSHDLSSVAKMLRGDVDVWYSFIDRPANRSEFIDIHEQFLGGFPDMSWENVRRVDMGDGWVFSEVKLKGTNKGKFLGKAATGLPMEVRSGLIEHYDEKGLADYVHFHFDTLSVPGQEALTGPMEDFSNVFFMELSPGLNMISAPLKPSTPFTARSLAEHIGATVVIKYDEAMGKFVGFDPKAQGNGFAIEGGKGYIVNVPKGGTAMFTGAAWTNEPSTPAAPAIAQRNNAWAFMLSGFLVDDDGIGISDGNYTLTVKNLSTGERFTGTVDTGGYFSLAWADLSRKPVVYSGHRLEIAMKDANGKLVSGPFIQEVTLDDIRDALANRWMKLGHIIPKQTALLQNYPNPFNPETWIPFQLAQDADVNVRIYHASGKLLREIALGRKEAGIYVDKSKAIYWDGKSDSGEKVAIGVYFYTIQAGEFSSSRKMIVNK